MTKDFPLGHRRFHIHELSAQSGRKRRGWSLVCAKFSRGFGQGIPTGSAAMLSSQSPLVNPTQPRLHEARAMALFVSKGKMMETQNSLRLFWHSWGKSLSGPWLLQRAGWRQFSIPATHVSCRWVPAALLLKGLELFPHTTTKLHGWGCDRPNMHAARGLSHPSAPRTCKWPAICTETGLSNFEKEKLCKRDERNLLRREKKTAQD